MARAPRKADDGPQLDADLAASYHRPSTSEAGRDLLVGIQAARERNRASYGRPTLPFLNREDDLDGDQEDDDDV